MFKKLKYLLKNFDTIKKIVEEYNNIATLVPEKKNKVSIAGVPDEQRKYIEENFKIEK